MRPGQVRPRVVVPAAVRALSAHLVERILVTRRIATALRLVAVVAAPFVTPPLIVLRVPVMRRRWAVVPVPSVGWRRRGVVAVPPRVGRVLPVPPRRVVPVPSPAIRGLGVSPAAVVRGRIVAAVPLLAVGTVVAVPPRIPIPVVGRLGVIAIPLRLVRGLRSATVVGALRGPLVPARLVVSGCPVDIRARRVVRVPLEIRARAELARRLVAEGRRRRRRRRWSARLRVVRVVAPVPALLGVRRVPASAAVVRALLGLVGPVAAVAAAAVPVVAVGSLVPRLVLGVLFLLLLRGCCSKSNLHLATLRTDFDRGELRKDVVDEAVDAVVLLLKLL